MNSDFDADEANEFLETMDEGEQPEEEVYDPKNPNAILNLDFDYTKLGEEKEFNRYLAKLEEIAPERGYSLGTDKMFDFELYRMLPVRKERYPGLEGTPIDFKGVVFKEDEPRLLVKTRITIKDARDYNNQITNAHSIAGHGKYYLLKQPGGITGKRR